MFEFDWKVLEIHADKDRRGATVRYTPLTEGLSEQTKFVPVPWHKARDPQHARLVMVKKIQSYAPSNVWAKEANPLPEDKSAEIVAELEGETLKGEQREESRTDTEGSGNSDPVSKPSGSEGE